METGVYVHCCKPLPLSSSVSDDQHQLALCCEAFLTSTGITIALPQSKLALSDYPCINQMTRQISVAYSGYQEEESHRPANCSCSSDGVALHHRSQLQHRRMGAGSYHHVRSTGKALPRS